MKFRAVYDDNEKGFVIESKKFLFWSLFMYGMNENGGQYYIKASTQEEAFEQLQKLVSAKRGCGCHGH